MPIYDISLSISNEMPVWPGDTPVRLARARDLRNGVPYTLSQITTSVHAGTHLDAPMHYLHDGDGVDQIDLNKLIGPCLVVDLPDVDSISARTLDKADIPSNTKRLLCRTRNSEDRLINDSRFHTDFVAVDPSGAEWIVQRGIQLVGIDYFSVGAYEAGTPTHEIFLKHGIVPVEGLELSHIEPGEYQLICLPLKLKGCDGAPVRAILMREE